MIEHSIEAREIQNYIDSQWIEVASATKVFWRDWGDRKRSVGSRRKALSVKLGWSWFRVTVDNRGLLGVVYEGGRLIDAVEAYNNS